MTVSMPQNEDRQEPLPAVLRGMISGEVLADEPMRRHTSIGVGGNADVMVIPADVEELKRVVSSLAKKGVKVFPVGNWTNIIARDGGYRGVIISLKRLKEITVNYEAGSRALISAGAGASLGELVQITLREGLTGMEFCAGIPGTVGGAVRMNAGAFGREIKDVLISASLMDQDGAIRNMKRKELEFEYRNLRMAEGDIVLSATFLLERGIQEQIRNRINEIMLQRRQKHPLEYRNAGSIFKNPRNVPAGMLIDEAGLKGTRVGDAMVSDKHGNFIVNVGEATAQDVLNLIDMVQKKVLADKGVMLETEVKVIGE